MKKIILSRITAFALLANLHVFAQYTMPASFFGVNGWMNNKIGDATNVYDCQGLGITYSATPHSCNLGGVVDNTIMAPTCSSKIKSLYVNLIRYGGKANDINVPTQDQLINEIDRIRSMGAEPIIQIPYNDGAYTATDASSLLTYLNTTRNKKIKYVAIGNEPDMYPGYASASDKADYVYNYFFTLASALKQVDPNIKIIGPSFASYSSSVYSHLLTSGDPASIVDADIHGHYVLDIVDIHTYPFKGDASQTRSNIISNPSSFATSLTGSSIGLLDYISTANAGRSGSPLQFSVSELNIDWQNPSSNTVSDLGTNGFIAGQWIADMYSVILDKARATGVDVAFVAPWSIYESGGNETTYDLGILDGSSPCSASERSTYEHMAMMGQYFKGSFYKGTNNSITNVKQFGTYLSGGYYCIMLLNEDATTTYPYTVNTNSSSGSTTLVVNMGMGGTNHLHANTTGIPPKTTHLLFFDCSGTWQKTLKYDETIASSHGAPSTFEGTGTLPIYLSTTVNNTGCTSNTSSGSASVSAIGGTGGYNYSWAPTGYTGGGTATYSGLPAGTYTVTVSNSSGSCTAGETAIVTIAPASPSVTITSPSNANSCASTQSFGSTVTGGTSPYTYSWSGSGGTGSSSSSYTQPSTANTVNIYTLTVTDTHGCINTAVCSHYANHSLSISGTTSASQCCGLTLTATYIPGASYSWTLNGTTISPASNPSAATHVLTYGSGFGGPGTYVATAMMGNLDPCSSVSATQIVTDGGHSCGCGQSPSPKGIVLQNAENSISDIIALVPNPTSSLTSVNYNLNTAAVEAKLVVTNIYGEIISQSLLNIQEHAINIDCSNLSASIYFCTLIVDGKKASTKKLLVTK